MGSLVISLIFTFNTLLVLAASFPWNWPPFNTPPGNFPLWPPLPRWQPLPPWPPFKPPPGWPRFPPFPPSPPGSIPGWPPLSPFPFPFPPSPPGSIPGGPPLPPFQPLPPGSIPGGPPLPPFQPSPPGFIPGQPPPNPPPSPSGNFPGLPPFKPPPLDAKSFFQCMIGDPPFSDFYAPNINKTLFTTILNSTAQNFRCLRDNIPKPIFILRPTEENQVSLAVRCAQLFDLNIRVRSGGHDYEGLSYISLIKGQQFMILDLFNLRNVSIDTRSQTAWVQAGATIGEFYYKVSQASQNLAFPAGLCSSLGVGGHLTGGAYGSMMRMFGLGADNVLDVRMVDAWGFVRSKEFGNMDDELFWALSGGGAANYGIILAWKVKLVTVPSKVTMFTVAKVLQQNGTAILDKWQRFAPFTDRRLFIRVIIQTIPNSVLTIYQALYLGSKGKLVSLMKKDFNELGVTAAQCTEMSWIESVMVIAGFNTSLFKTDYLLQGKPAFLSSFFKAKSDFVYDFIPKDAFAGMWKIFMEQSPPSVMIWNPYGGMMAEIPVNKTPFPHRLAIMKIQYVATWLNDSAKIQLDLEDWIRKLYTYMAPYVSKNPREAYVNYRDLDVGKMEGTGSNCSYPDIWGPKYFKDNYPRLVEVKSQVDPSNFFRNEQSIPPKWMQNQCTQVI